MDSKFQKVLSDAIEDMARFGFDSQNRVDTWVERIRQAAVESLIPEAQLQAALSETFGAIYQRAIEREGLLNRHDGVARFTLARVKPKLREEFDRRRLMAAQLIKLNRAESIQKVQQRFAAWASSVPLGGTRQLAKRNKKDEIRKSLSSLPFEERRVLIDQGHKFNSALSEILAADGNAIAATWRSHWRQVGYKFRPDHKARDELVYAVRGNWAILQGLMKPGFAGYTDEIDKPGEAVFCRCYFIYLYHLRDLPPDMVTVKGRKVLDQVRAAA